MKILQLTFRQKKYLKKRNLTKKFNKQKNFLLQNPQHPSLNLELLQPKSESIYSFRIDKQYRALFIVFNNKVEIIDINNHYK